ncbi:hypothetical protein AAY473_028907 [Plecturocebus cupreus]
MRVGGALAPASGPQRPVGGAAAATQAPCGSGALSSASQAGASASVTDVQECRPRGSQEKPRAFKPVYGSPPDSGPGNLDWTAALWDLARPHPQRGAGKVNPGNVHHPGAGALSQPRRDYSPLLVGGDALDVLRGAVGRCAGPPHARAGRHPRGRPAGRRGRHLHAEIRKDSDHRRGFGPRARRLWARAGGGSGSGSGGGGSSASSGGGSSGARHQPAIPLVSRGHCARRRGALMCAQRAGGGGAGAGSARRRCGGRARDLQTAKRVRVGPFFPFGGRRCSPPLSRMLLSLAAPAAPREPS